MTTIVEFPGRQPADPDPTARRGRVWRSPRRVWIRHTWVRAEREPSTPAEPSEQFGDAVRRAA